MQAYTLFRYRNSPQGDISKKDLIFANQKKTIYEKKCTYYAYQKILYKEDNPQYLFLSYNISAREPLIQIWEFPKDET